MQFPSAFKKSALAFLAAAAVIAVIACVALYGNHEATVVQLVRSCKALTCGDHALLDCDSTSGGSLYVYARADGRFLADCDTSNPAQLNSQPLCSTVFEALKSCPASKTKQLQ